MTSLNAPSNKANLALSNLPFLLSLLLSALPACPTNFGQFNNTTKRKSERLEQKKFQNEPFCRPGRLLSDFALPDPDQKWPGTEATGPGARPEVGKNELGCNMPTAKDFLCHKSWFSRSIQSCKMWKKINPVSCFIRSVRDPSIPNSCTCLLMYDTSVSILHQCLETSPLRWPSANGIGRSENPRNQYWKVFRWYRYTSPKSRSSFSKTIPAVPTCKRGNKIPELLSL